MHPAPPAHPSSPFARSSSTEALVQDDLPPWGTLALEHLGLDREALWELVQRGSHCFMTQDGVEHGALSPHREGGLCSESHLGRAVLSREATGEGLPCGVGSVTHFCDVLGFCKIPQVICPPAGSRPGSGELPQLLGKSTPVLPDAVIDVGSTPPR